MLPERGGDPEILRRLKERGWQQSEKQGLQKLHTRDTVWQGIEGAEPWDPRDPHKPDNPSLIPITHTGRRELIPPSYPLTFTYVSANAISPNNKLKKIINGEFTSVRKHEVSVRFWLSGNFNWLRLPVDQIPFV